MRPSKTSIVPTQETTSNRAWGTEDWSTHVPCSPLDMTLFGSAGPTPKGVVLLPSLTFFYHLMSPGHQHNTDPPGDPHSLADPAAGTTKFCSSPISQRKSGYQQVTCTYKWLNHPLVSKPRQDLPTFPIIHFQYL